MAKSKGVDAALALFKEKDIKFVDLRFTDPRGKLQHVTMDVSLMDEDAFSEGVFAEKQPEGTLLP